MKLDAITLNYYQFQTAALPSRTPLIVTAQEAEKLAANGALILDATAKLEKPLFDGDYRLDSGYSSWIQERIPASRHADLVNTLSHHQPLCSFAYPEPEALVSSLRDIGLGESMQAVLYDSQDGLWAARLWWMLRAIGFDAYFLNGGLNAWRNAGLPLDRGAPDNGSVQSASPHPLVGKHSDGFWTDIAITREISAGRAPGTLVCALSRDLYEGKAVTRYARRGHIPNSINLPARIFLDEHSQIRPPAEIAEKAKRVLDGFSAPYILYCGGGITAALLALALSAAGYEDLSIYSGSLQEWTSHPDLALVCGPSA
jgi:thiosulfate/3-mercaptopyruvate sulfurtransferase